MRLDLRRDALVIIPESDQDRAYIEDTLGLKGAGATATFERVADVSFGYIQKDTFVLKSVARPSTTVTVGQLPSPPSP